MSHMCLKQKMISYLKFRLNWASYISSGNPIRGVSVNALWTEPGCGQGVKSKRAKLQTQDRHTPALPSPTPPSRLPPHTHSPEPKSPE